MPEAFPKNMVEDAPAENLCSLLKNVTATFSGSGWFCATLTASTTNSLVA